MPALPSPARVAAARILLRLQQDSNAFSAEALDNSIRSSNLAPRDARLATSMVYGTLRHALLLDHQYRPFLRQAPSRLSPQILVLLRMAAFQRLMLERIPDHAIASDSVEIARRIFRLHTRDVAFINALVRRIVGLEKLNVPAGADSAALSVRYSHPQWLVEYLARKFDPAAMDTILEAALLEPALSVRVNRLRTTWESLECFIAELGGSTSRGLLSPDALLVHGIPTQTVVQHPRFLDGDFYLQDEGSQLIAHLVAARPDERILDMCAAPGGKTTHLAELSHAQALITATDISEPRLRLLHENIDRLRTPGVEVVDHKALMENPANHGRFDAVLVDAPCSGLGTTRRNPEIRYRASLQQIISLSETQLTVLEQAASFVKPGGRLIYSTCTITDEENHGVIKRFLEGNPRFQIAPPPPGLSPSIKQLRSPEGYYSTWPTHPHIDGFEAVILQRANA